LAERPAVLGRQRHARLRRTAQLAALPDLRAARGRHRAPLQDLQVRAVDRHPRVQRAVGVPADRRPVESRVAGVRIVLQLRLPPVPPAGSLRALTPCTRSLWHCCSWRPGRASTTSSASSPPIPKTSPSPRNTVRTRLPPAPSTGRSISSRSSPGGRGADPTSRSL